MTVWKRMLVIVVLACLVMAYIPASASAVDPVMTTAMANAFAQAVAAYGASQGVSITFDVANTDGIGEGVHELWNEFKTQTQDQDVETFDSYAVTLFYNLFKKSSGGGNNNNNDDDKVAIAISAATVAALDKFWNWLLSGPAEMEKVDNQYYEWSVNNNNEIVPISVFSNSVISINGCPLNPLPVIAYYGNDWMSITSEDNVYAIIYQESTPTWYDAFLITLDNTAFNYSRNWSYQTPTNSISQAPTSSSGNRYWNKVIFNQYFVPTNVELTPYIPGGQLVDYIGDYNDQDSLIVADASDLSVRPYVYDPIVQPVTIPDPDDPDYDPQDLILPLNVPWDVTMFGDGTDPMDDSQAEAAADAIGDSIMTSPDRAIELNPSSDAPVTPPSEVYIPFLPVQLPSFNFSLSGIWHYVIDWVASLGAWFTTVFTIWSNLPYAIVLPVYASAVIVIVLGVYKRFFM